MKLTVLVDNNTIIDQYYYGEPAVSYYIEIEGARLLFDVGYSDLFLRNAKYLKKDIDGIDYVVLSHGHDDHTGGLVALQERQKRFANDTDSPRNNSALIGHPEVFLPKAVQGQPIGSPISQQQLSRDFNLILTRKPYWLTNNLVFLGEIPRRTDFENSTPIGEVYKDGSWRDDYVLDDSALVYHSNDGLVIASGCAHSGICNTISYARELFGGEKVRSVIGGFHLLDPSELQLQETVRFLAALQLSAIYPCHCTGFQSKVEMAKVMNVREIGVSTELTFN